MNDSTVRARARSGRLQKVSVVAIISLGLPARWTGAQPCHWEGLAGGGFTGRVFALAAFPEGAGVPLYAGGTFRQGLGSPASFIAWWNEGEWLPVGKGLGETVLSLTVFDDGSGPALYAGGVFARAGDIPDANGIARWDGVEWSALGTGIRNITDPPRTHNAAAMIVFDNGSGPGLYVGGAFTHAGGMPALNIARWDGRDWSPLGEGLYGSVGVRALAVYDDGSGPALYAGGYIHGRVMRWDGEAWAEVGVPGVGNIEAFAVFDDGTGPALYAGGQFAGGIARWDGAQWTSLGTGTDYTVRSLHVFDDGTGPALFVGGGFHHAGDEQVFGIAKWDGRQWHGLDGGVYHAGGISADALTTFDDGSGPALYVAGRFTHAAGPAGIPVENIARWRCTACYADCDRDGALTFFDFLCFQNLFAAMDPGADCDGDSAFTFFDFLCFQNAFAAGCP